MGKSRVFGFAPAHRANLLSSRFPFSRFAPDLWLACRSHKRDAGLWAGDSRHTPHPGRDSHLARDKKQIRPHLHRPPRRIWLVYARIRNQLGKISRAIRHPRI